MANNDCLIKFAGSEVHHLHCGTSNHNPLWIVPDVIETARTSKPFHFEEMWLSDRGCDETIEAIWTNINHVDPGIQVVNKINKCGKALTSWSRNCFGSVRRDLEQARKKLVQAEKDAMISGVNFQVLELRSKVNDLIDKENRMWFQRSRSLWTIHRDRNSKYFHSKATQRLRRNKIRGIKNSAGLWITNPIEVAD